jgi:hypothetical protein
MIVSIRSFRKLLIFALALLALGGCGSDDEPTPPATQEGTVSEETTATSETETETSAPNPETETLPNDGDGTGTGESGQGGAGDEQAAETLALLTGENGAITPAVVRVPAFISIRVELRSADGGAYELKFGDKTIEVGDGLSSRSTTFEGLRPGAKLVGTGTGGKVRIEATAEPGP